MAYPESGGTEWVELYNDNHFPVTLTNWYIDDGENTGSTPKLFSMNILAKSYSSFDLATSMFNNDGDEVRLLDPTKQLKDSFEYSATERSKSLGRTSLDNDVFCQQEPSRNGANNFCTITIISPTPSPKITPLVVKTLTKPSTAIPKPTPQGTLNALHVKKTRFQKINSQKIVSSPTNSHDPEILGASTVRNTDSSGKPIAKTFSLLSLSYSFLSMVSIGLKIKTSLLS
jgi:hypothetical protein